MVKNGSGQPDFKPIYRGRGRVPAGPVAVIDIGSNSIRLVVYDRLDRSPLPIFNEKVLCGLGRGLAATGRLNPEGVGLARANLARFARLLRELRVFRVDVLATAAVRDARDGPDFVAEIEAVIGRAVTILPGEDEARLSALGVLSGMPGITGLMGDLGGGSLELVGIEDGRIAEQATLPLGPFRMTGRPRAEIVARIDAMLETLGWLDRYQGRDFFPVGGAWRSIAKALLAVSNHPLKVIHQHTVRTADLIDLVRVIARQGGDSLAKLPGVSKRRLETLPYGALLFERLVSRFEPGQVVFSAYGLREGHLFSLLPSGMQALDPLLHAADKIDARSVDWTRGGDIHEWIGPLFPDEEEDQARLRRTACLLSDAGAGEHPEYRAENAFLMALRAPMPAITHAGRAFVGLSLLVRYGGKTGTELTAAFEELLTEEQRARAQVLGTALRLAHTLTAGATGVLRQSSLEFDNTSVALRLGPGDSVLDGEVVSRRLEALARALDRPAATLIGYAEAAE